MMKRRTLLHALAVTALLGAYLHSAFVLHYPRPSPDGFWYITRALALHESGALPDLAGHRPLHFRWLDLLMRVDPDFAGYLRCLEETVPRWPGTDPRWAERFGGVREGKETLVAACRPLANVGIYAQALLGAVGVGLVGLAGWLASRRALVAYLSVLAALLLGGNLYYSFGYATENLVVPLLAGFNVCLAWLALDRRAGARRRAGAALACGLLLGLLVLTRPPYEVLLAFLPPAAAVLALRDRARRRAIGVAAAGVLLGAALFVTPWTVRGGGGSTTYAYTTLAYRLTQNDMTWRQWLAAFPFWTGEQAWETEPGNDAATRWFGTRATAPLDKRHPDFFLRRWNETTRTWKAHVERGPLFLSGRILAELPKHLAVSVPLAWRGMSAFRSGPFGIGPYAAVVWLLLLFAFARGAPRNRRALAALTFCPAVLLAVQALVTPNSPRFNIGLLLPLSVASALCCAWAIDGAGARLRRWTSTLQAPRPPWSGQVGQAQPQGDAWWR